MNHTSARFGPRKPHAMQPGARRVSPEHVQRLRAIVAEDGNVHAAARRTGMSPEGIEDALTGKIFRRKTVESHEAKIDAARRARVSA